MNVYVSFGGPTSVSSSAWHSETSTGDVSRFETGDEDNFSQCGKFFRDVLSAAERERLTDNIAGNLIGAQEFIQKRAIANFAAADAGYGQMVKAKVDKIKAKGKAIARASAAAPLNPPRNISKI